ncbi:MAG: acyl carrier protein [Helicobacter sp.]|nr:acyl carrier protein [Helicobacter sp.]
MEKEQIFEMLKKALIELFEIEESRISLEAKIYEDLEIDSIDAIDMIDYIKKNTGYRMEANYFKEVKTLQDIVEVVYKQLKNNA